MVRSRRAPVRPRIVSPETGDAIPLDEEVELLIAAGTHRAIEIRGADGAGKTTALEHLAALLTEADGLTLLDEPTVGEILAELANASGRVIYTCRQRTPLALASYALAGWTDDDLIEYLLAVHPGQCASVATRLQDDGFGTLLQGTPELWRCVLDEMAGDAALSGIRPALRRAVRRRFADERTGQLAAGFSLAALLGDEEQMAAIYMQLVSGHCRADDRLLRHRAVRLLLGAEQLVADLEHAVEKGTLAARYPRDLLCEAGQLVAGDRAAARRLRRRVRSLRGRGQSVAASVLHAAGVPWRPRRRNACLQRASLACVQWHKIRLVRPVFFAADLSHADLTQADLREAHLCRCKLRGAALAGARLIAARLCRADLRAADLSGIVATSARFRRADLTGTNLRQAVLTDADFTEADLSGARFCGADLSSAVLAGAKIADADFTGANLQRAILERLALRTATMADARFAGARLCESDLEFMELPGADFERADLSHAALTATVMPRANFHSAKLRAAGLADVQWEGADLRGADLRDCSFHMGSSRSGLVGSPYPGHGSRTGFYTDAFDDRYYAAPEEIRKANLRFADLRGARIANADFYLVDLRGARYDADQADHLRRCDAILEDVT